MNEPHFRVLQNDVQVAVVPIRVIDEMKARYTRGPAMFLSQFLNYVIVAWRVILNTTRIVAAVLGVMLLVAILADHGFLAEVFKIFQATPDDASQGISKFVAYVTFVAAFAYHTALALNFLNGKPLPGYRNLATEVLHHRLRVVLTIPGEGALELEPIESNTTARTI